MILDALAIMIAAMSSGLLFGLLQVTMLKQRRQNALGRMEVEHAMAKHRMLTQRAGDVANRLQKLAAQCRDFAPDNSIRCTHDTGHIGLHSDGNRCWYGNVWFPLELESK